ncbi:MAG: hypothetical protein CK425_03530 [Parachlamydia sp.]|nr:MAG: hypothetical protein CK425_03530 [Parachlamydia sp.]
MKNKLIQISALVVLGHLLVLGSAYFHFWPEYAKSVQPRKLAVQTISLQKAAPVSLKNTPPVAATPVKASPLPPPPSSPPPPKKIVKAAPPVKKAVPEIKKPLASPKKKVEKKPVKAAAPEIKTALPKPPPETTPLAQLKEKQQALAIARENIAKIQLKGDKVNALKQQTSNLAKVELLNIDHLEQNVPPDASSAEATYQEELAYYLKQHLHLVEVGDVKIKLTLSKKGEVVQFNVVYAESRLNRELIEKEIPGLCFPGWDQRLTSHQTYTCCVTLSHDQLSPY